MIINVLDNVLLVHPNGTHELVQSPHSFTEEEIRESAVFAMASDAARTGEAQQCADVRVLPPNSEGVSDVFINDALVIVVDPDADELHAT